jgi:glycosyltransferase involved in cell wall biosynthesis
VISVVVPVHDEERSIEPLYEELRVSLEPLARPWEAVFVDDGSTDGSLAALTRLHALAPNVKVVRLRRNFGKAAALAAGFRHADGDVVVTIDADLQDDPAEIPRLLAKLDEGFDLVSGWKTQRRDPLSRRIPSRIFNAVVGRVSGLRLHDLNCGLKAYRADVVHNLRIYGELHRFLPVLALYLYKVSGGLMFPSQTNTGLLFVTKDNVDPYLQTKTRFEGSSTEQQVVQRSGAIAHS